MVLELRLAMGDRVASWFTERNVLVLGLLGIALMPALPSFPLCPSQWFGFGDCPTCGVTRGIRSLLRGDLAGSLRYNPIALLIVVVAVRRIMQLSSDSFARWCDSLWVRRFDVVLFAIYAGLLLRGSIFHDFWRAQ